MFGVYCFLKLRFLHAHEVIEFVSAFTLLLLLVDFFSPTEPAGVNLNLRHVTKKKPKTVTLCRISEQAELNLGCNTGKTPFDCEKMV